MSINLPMFTADEMGRTEIHNAIIHHRCGNSLLIYCNRLIHKFIIQGCDVDQQDISGKTALHYAALLGNKVAIIGLLDYGADINIFDKNGKTAFFYSIDNFYRDQATHELALGEIVKHIRLLENLGIYVSKFNRDLLYENAHLIPNSSFRFCGMNSYRTFRNCIESTKDDPVGVRSLTLFDLLSETKLLNMYPRLNEVERYTLDKFYQSAQYEICYGLKGVWKLQIRKAKLKWDLLQPAAESLTKLTGYVFPDVYELIFQSLSVHDLRNLITSSL